MKLLQSLLLVSLLPLITGCPKPRIPEFCSAPERISVQDGCYNDRTGLILSASKPPGTDQSIALKWWVYVVADSLIGAPFNNPQLRDISSGMNLTVADSLLGNNLKVYVEIRSECAGYPQNKAQGLIAAAFIKRYNRSTNCYQWAQQPL